MRSVDRDHPVLLAVTLDYDHRPRLDHEEVGALIAGGKENLAGLDGAHATQAAQPCPLVVVESRERAVAIDDLRDSGPDPRLRAAHRIIAADPSSAQS